MTDLTMSILDGECFGSRRVRLGRSSGTDGMSGEREFELQPDHSLGSGRFGFGCKNVLDGPLDQTDLGLEFENSDELLRMLREQQCPSWTVFWMSGI